MSERMNSLEFLFKRKHVDGRCYLLKCYSFREVPIGKEDTKGGRRLSVAWDRAISCYSQLCILRVILNQQPNVTVLFQKLSHLSVELALLKINVKVLNASSSDLAMYTNFVTYLTSYGMLSIHIFKL